MPTPTIPALEGTEEFQMTGLTEGIKQSIKTSAIKRNVSASALLVAAYQEYEKRHPLS